MIAQWQNKKWEVTPYVITALEDLSTSYKLQKENKADAEGKPATNIRGLELEPLSFSMQLHDGLGVDVRKEIDEWKALIGTSGAFILGGQRFGAASFLLEEVSVGDVVLDDIGRMRAVKLDFQFIENSKEAAKDKPEQKQTASNQKTPGIAAPKSQKGTGKYTRANKKAPVLKPTVAEKEKKKPNNPYMSARSEV